MTIAVLTVILVLLVQSPVSIGAETNETLQCVVCLPRENNSAADDIYELFPGQNITECGARANEQLLLKECPPGSTGCNKQSTDKWQAKSCSFIRANDCQIANGVQYCYCTGNRCNLQFNVPRYTEMIVQQPAATTSGSLHRGQPVNVLIFLAIHFLLLK